jgi:hypothetical protein
MPGRSLTSPDDKRRKLAAYKASRARAQAGSEPTAIELELARGIMREVQAGSNVAEACARRKLRSFDFWDWLARAPQLVVEWDKAQANRALAYGEQPVGIADEAPMFYVDKGVRRIDPGFVQLQKLRINARQWDAERLQSGRYAPPSTAADRGPVAVTVVVERFVVGSAERAQQGEQVPDDAEQRERMRA